MIGIKIGRQRSGWVILKTRCLCPSEAKAARFQALLPSPCRERDHASLRSLEWVRSPSNASLPPPEHGGNPSPITPFGSESASDPSRWRAIVPCVIPAEAGIQKMDASDPTGTGLINSSRTLSKVRGSNPPQK